jgi:hypothetical protein
MSDVAGYVRCVHDDLSTGTNMYYSCILDSAVDGVSWCAGCDSVQAAVAHHGSTDHAGVCSWPGCVHLPG